MAEVDHNKWKEKLIWVRKEILTLRERHPEELYLLSVLLQLDYLIALEEGVESDDSALEDINMGRLAVYPLADILPHDVSEALCEIDEEVRKTIRRRKRKCR